MFQTLMRMLFLEMVEIFLLTSWETFLILSLVSLIAALDRFLALPGPRSRHESGCSSLGDIAENQSCKLTTGEVFTNTEKAPTRAFSWLKAYMK